MAASYICLYVELPSFERLKRLKSGAKAMIDIKILGMQKAYLFNWNELLTLLFDIRVSQATNSEGGSLRCPSLCLQLI